ncbi:MAG TPA: thiamine-phosphate kinase [Gemmatimonadaceae bacterium]|nr:thiamine-phosphate kinase [Gemmatimonadaceae bacterium]
MIIRELTTALGPGAEFNLVRRFAEEWGPRASGLGDDAAILPLAPGMHVVVSTDTSVERVHFARAWLTPYEIGWRATVAGLSDLAAMGAQPLGLLMALTLPDSWLDEVPEIAAGIGDAAAASGTRIVGGDLTRGAELALCATVLGSAAEPLTRSGARAGDRMYVTGRLGGAGAALRAWESGREPVPEHRERFARPHPRIREAQWLASRGAHAAIDVSDGLVADIHHIAAASSVAVELHLELIPTARSVSPADAAASGEEYEVVVCAPDDIDVLAFREAFSLDLSEIGRVLGSRSGGEVAVLQAGERVDPPRGHDHFSR